MQLQRHCCVPSRSHSRVQNITSHDLRGKQSVITSHDRVTAYSSNHVMSQKRALKIRNREEPSKEKSLIWPLSDVKIH